MTNNVMITEETKTSWQTDDPYRLDTIDDVRRALIEDSGFRAPIVDRGLKRLGDVTADGNNRWLVVGRPELSDYFPFYSVTLDGYLYHCTCHGHEFGESRRRRFCSHVVAVIAARRLGKVEMKPKSRRFVLTPADLGLPAKFPEFRQVQLEAFDRIQATQKKHIFVAGPTGSGKSAIAAGVQRLLKTKMLYIAFTKQLQRQFVNDFSRDLEGKEWAIELKGRANYPTLRYPHLFPRINCSMCVSRKEMHCRWCCDKGCEPTHDGKCGMIVHCPYRVQKAKALMSELAVLNFDIFVNEANYVGAFSGRFPFICIDEGDLTEKGLLGFVELAFTKRWVERLGLSPPKHKTVEDSWLEWVEEAALPAIHKELRALTEAYGVEDLRREDELKRMGSKIKFFSSEMKQTKWVFSAEENKWSWKPVFVSKYANRYIWQHSDRFLLMSATIISSDEMAHNLGIPREEIEFIDLQSTFPKERRPIYYTPEANITYKTEVEEKPKAIKGLDKILPRYPNDKILVHSVSHPFAKQIVETSQHRARMVTYSNAREREAVLENFKKSDQPLVLVASSFDRGIDLPGELCRVVVIMKVPFLKLGDKQVSARLHSDKKGGQLWFNVAAIRTLVQMSGRAMRSEDDYCEIYILDSQFARLFKENKYLFPAWWREALHMPKP